MELKLLPIEMRRFSAYSSNVREYCANQVSDCDIFVMIIGSSIGKPAIADVTSGKTYQEFEHDVAVAKGKEILVFEYVQEAQPQDSEAKRLLEKITDMHGKRSVKSPDELGAKGIGSVVAVGPGVTLVQSGDRVGVPWLYSACGHCEYCLSAWETVCAEAQYGGYTMNGGFAEYIIANPNYVARIPEGLKSTEAAPIICAGVTTYKGIKETNTRPGQWIAISGIGGLGHLAVQYARVMGLRVCAIDVDDSKLEHAQRLGAELLVNAKSVEPVESVRHGTGGGAHGVLITATSLGAFKQGVGMTRKLGTCVLIGLPPGEFPTPLFDVVAKCITIRGSFVGTRIDMAEALAFAAQGKVKADIELQPLSAINEVLDRLEHGQVASRVVIDFAGL